MRKLLKFQHIYVSIDFFFIDDLYGVVHKIKDQHLNNIAYF